MKKKLLLLISLSFVITNLIAQNYTSCGADEIIKSNPEIKKRLLEIEKIIQDKRSASNLIPDLTTIYTIPLVFHIYHLGEAIGVGSNVSDAEINATINRLNSVFRATGIHSGITPDVKIQFVLASYNSNCQPTNGIVRVDGRSISGYQANPISFNDYNMHQSLRTLSSWDDSKYINIRICHNTNGWGWAYFLGDIFMEATSVRYASGNFWSHEMGHSMNLNHTFEGDGGNQFCPPNANPDNDGDKISDTDPHKRDDGCNYSAINPCTGNPFGNVLKNIMSYSCWETFTPKQLERMRFSLINFRQNLINSKGITGIIPPPIANSNSRCLTGSVTLTANGGCSGTYKWFASNVGDIILNSGSTFISPSISATTTYYVSCSEGSCTSTRTAVQAVVNTTLSLSCYCNEAIRSTYTDYMDISNTTIGNLNNSSTCSTTGTIGSVQNVYSNYTNLTPVNFIRGSTNNVNIQATSCNNVQVVNSIKVFIDFNQNGLFSDVGESFFISNNISASSPNGLGSILISNNATLGNTFMRVVLGYEWDINSDGSCGNIYWGETEDYKINIVQPCQLPTATLTGTRTITAGQTANLSVALTGVAPWSLVMNVTTYIANASPFSISVNPIITTIYALTSVSNSCSTGTVSGSAVVTVNACTNMYSILSGNWNTNTTWSCNRQPTITDNITISPGHTVTIPSGATGFLNRLSLNGRLINNGRLKYKEL